jgi:hypothetical protein
MRFASAGGREKDTSVIVFNSRITLRGIHGVRQPEGQLALAADREPGVIGVNPHSPPIQAQRSKALAKKIPLDDALADPGMKLRHLGVPADLARPKPCRRTPWPGS